MNTIKTVPTVKYASDKKIIECVHSVLEKCTKYNVSEINITLVLRDLSGQKMRLNIDSND